MKAVAYRRRDHLGHRGAGGVGSITIQLLRALTDLTVIATAPHAGRSCSKGSDQERRCSVSPLLSFPFVRKTIPAPTSRPQ